MVAPEHESVHAPDPSERPGFAPMSEAARRYKVSIRTLQRLADTGLITRYKVARAVRLDLSECDAVFRRAGQDAA